MNTEQKQLKDFTLTELKAIVYDKMAILERTQFNLKALNEEIARRKQQGEQVNVDNVEKEPYENTEKSE